MSISPPITRASEANILTVLTVLAVLAVLVALVQNLPTAAAAVTISVHLLRPSPSPCLPTPAAACGTAASLRT
ncbi:hypothetical protein THAOC_21838, partial [Thalassiosira oceanica]